MSVHRFITDAVCSGESILRVSSHQNQWKEEEEEEEEKEKERQFVE